jgi:gas vesicle protein
MNKSSKTFWAFMAGAAAGAILGILYAPDKGENTRNKLYYQLNKYRDQLKQLLNDLIDGKEIHESLAKAEGKKVVNEAREKAERLLEDVETMMSQIKTNKA